MVIIVLKSVKERKRVIDQGVVFLRSGYCCKSNNQRSIVYSRYSLTVYKRFFSEEHLGKDMDTHESKIRSANLRSACVIVAHCYLIKNMSNSARNKNFSTLHNSKIQ